MSKYDVISEKFKQIRVALKLQAKEYERRLKALNGEGKRINEVLKQSVPREVFESVVKELRDKIEVLTAAKLKADGKSNLVQYVIPIILTIAGLVMMWLAYNKK